VLHERIVLLTVATEHIPWVPEEERLETVDVGNGVHRVKLRFGFMETPNVPDALEVPFAEMGVTDRTEILYVLGRETYVGTSANRMGAISESMFDFLSRNARRATDYFGIPPEQVMELGSYVDL